MRIVVLQLVGQLMLAFASGAQCGGCIGGVTEHSVEPCLENATYCEGWTALIQIPELSQNLTETFKWTDIVETARRLYVNAGKTIKGAYQVWRKAREAWEYAKGR